MIHNFIDALKAEPNVVRRKAALLKLSDKQFKVLEHIYLNKNMLTAVEFKAYINDGVSMCPERCYSLLDILDYAAGDYDPKKLTARMLKYLYVLELYEGKKSCRKAAKIMLRDERIEGITMRDIKQVADLRRQ